VTALMSDPAGARLTPAQQRNRRLRNVAIGLAVAFLAVMFYAITIVKMAPDLLLKATP
jgi:hypothetical protein